MRHPSPQLAPGGSDQVDIKHKTVVQISMHCILFSLSLSRQRLATTQSFSVGHAEEGRCRVFLDGTHSLKIFLWKTCFVAFLS